MKKSSLRTLRTTLFAIATASLLTATRADVIDNSLLVRFNFDAAPVNDVIADTSLAGAHPGTNVLANWVDAVDGRTGVMHFDTNAPSQILLAPAADLNGSVGTIAFWMKSPAVNQDPNPYVTVFDRRSAGGDVLYQDPDGHIANQATQASGGGANSGSTSISLTDDKWHHFAYVYDQGPSGSVSLYVDGVLDSSKPNSLAWSWPADQEIELGKSHDSFWAAYDGFLDDFRIYNRMLTSSEIGNIAGLAATPAIVLTPGNQPQDITAAAKDNPVFSVKASAVNADQSQLTYQWQRNGVNISGATNSTYSLTVAQADDQAKFRVIISLPGATPVTSNEAILTVVPELSLRFAFDAEPVNDVIVDSTTGATKHDGTNIGATWVASQDGRNGVMSFDGDLSNEITIPAAPDLNSKRGTIAFWMKSALVTQTPNPYAIIFDRRTSQGDVLYQDPSGAVANQVAGGLNANQTTVNLTDDKWHHFAYTYDQNSGGSVSLYVDGVLNRTGVNDAPWSWPVDQEIEIGESHDNFWAGYSGFLDEFRIYNRVLPASEIATLAGLGPQPQIVISRQPAGLTTGVNDTPSLSVKATVVNGQAANLTYQWQKDGVNIPGATSATLPLTVTQADDGKKFKVILSYTGATNVTSTEVTLTVLPEFVVNYPFDAEPVNDVIVDTSPGGNNGVNSGATWVASESGHNGVMSFDPNVPSQILINAAPNLNSMRGTISFWMKSPQTTPTPNPYAMVVDRRAMPNDGMSAVGGDVLFQLPDGHISDQAEVTGRARANAFSATKQTTDGTWHHLAYVYDQTATGFVGFYVDGVLDGKHNNAFAWYWVPEEPIEIAKSHDPFWSAYGGFMDEFRIYNRVLSDAEIAQLAGLVVNPTLSMTATGRNASITWSAAGFVLQENTDLGNANGWTNVTGGSTSPYNFTIPDTAGVKFYRLIKP